MINLLPYEKRDEIHAGRANVIILNYIVLSIIAAALLALVMVGSYVTLSVSRANAQSRVDDQQAQTSKYAATKQEATVFRSNLATAKDILSSETKYSTLLTKIAAALPNGVVIDALELSPDTFDKVVTLTAHAKTYDDALKLKSSFESKTDLFSDVHFASVQNGSSDDGSDGSGNYPINVSLSVIIKKEATK